MYRYIQRQPYKHFAQNLQLLPNSLLSSASSFEDFIVFFSSEDIKVNTFDLFGLMFDLNTRCGQLQDACFITFWYLTDKMTNQELDKIMVGFFAIHTFTLNSIHNSKIVLIYLLMGLGATPQSILTKTNSLAPPPSVKQTFF